MPVKNRIIMLEHIMLKTLIISVASLLLETSATGITRNDMKVLDHYDIDQFKDDTQVCLFTHSQRTVVKILSGSGNFMHFIQNTKIWVDKSLLAKAAMKTADYVLLITTPRKWGKSLNLDMLRLIFERNFIDPGPNPVKSDVHRFFIEGKVYSEGVKICEADKKPLISKEADFLKKFFQKFLVIHLNFAKMRPNNWRRCFKEEVRMQYDKHLHLLKKMYSIAKHGNDTAEQDAALGDIEDFKMYLHKKYDEDQFTSSIVRLCQLFHRYYNVQCIILIDEFDAIQNDAIFNNWEEYEEKENGVEFVRSFMHDTFKHPQESFIRKGVLTGIVRAAKATLLNGLNNILEYDDVNLVNMLQYTPFYGFTYHEAKTLLCNEKQSCDKLINTALTWYDGYGSLCLHRGTTFNPWSIMRFAHSKKAKSYWENTSSQETISNLLRYDFFENLVYNLLYTNKGYEISSEKLYKMENTMLREIRSLLISKEDPLTYEYGTISKITDSISDSIVLYMCQSGYLTIGSEIYEDAEQPEGKVRLVIPNLEIRYELQKLFIPTLKGKSPLHANEYEKVITNCAYSFSKWFLRDFSINYESETNDIFEVLRSDINTLFKKAGTFADLLSMTSQKKSGEMLRNYQHLSEATVRKTLAPVLEKFRVEIHSTFMEEWSIHNFGMLDTQIFLGDKLLIIEYKCDSRVTIENVLQQAMNYTSIIMSHSRVYKWVKFLAINVYKKDGEQKKDELTVDIKHNGMIWSEAEKFVQTQFNTAIDELRKPCQICQRRDTVTIRFGVKEICESCSRFCKRALLQKTKFEECCLSGDNNCEIKHNDKNRIQGFCKKCRLEKCKKAGFSEENFTLEPPCTTEIKTFSITEDPQDSTSFSPNEQ